MSRLEHDYTSVAETFSMASVSSSMIPSDIVLVYKIMSNHIKCTELRNLFPIYSPNLKQAGIKFKERRLIYNLYQNQMAIINNWR